MGNSIPRRPGETLVDHFRSVLLGRPALRTYQFLVDGEGEPQTLTNAELDVRARALAAILRERVPAGERALIVSPPGIDYVTAFFACLYAGVIAVPVYPPNPALLMRTLPRLLAVIEDARPAVVLAPALIASMADQLSEYAPALAELSWQSIDEVDDTLADAWRHPGTTGSDIAFLQYTSGSTGQPKGVMLSHANLVANIQAISRLFVGDDPDSHGIIWLPPYHDMGLIGGLLTPAYATFSMTFMSPLAFLKHPLRWLRAISDFGGTISGGPNFAYDLCVSKIPEPDRAGLDLSTWRVAFTGAEPVRAETIDRFTDVYGPYGFRREAFYPCYGLAEATLIVSGGARAAAPIVRELSATALAAHAAAAPIDSADTRLAVGCGPSLVEQRVVVVDPETRVRLEDGRIGEIWVSGPSVASGYWQRPQETEETFAAHLADTGEGPFLRTGDLGFVDGTELYVTGRRKDLIIIAGRNHYPQDIERTVEGCHPALRLGCGVACGVDAGREERLLIVHELESDPAKVDADEVFAAIRRVVADGHDVQVHDIVLVRRGSVPKTSSGKLQRRACRDAYLDGDLEVAAAWHRPEAPVSRVDTANPLAVADVDVTLADGAVAGSPAAMAPAGAAAVNPVLDPVLDPAADTVATVAGAAAGRARADRRAEIEARLCEEVAARLNVAPAGLDTRAPIAGFGLGSVDLVGLAGELERWLGAPLPATLAWEYPTIEALADYLAGYATGATPDPVPAAAVTGSATANGAGPATVTAEPIAIVGIGCRLPGGVDGPDSFWRLLSEGRDAITEVPADRWNVSDYVDDDPTVPGKTTTRWGGFVDGVDRFDPHFFGISPLEAARMDPQQRVLAEVAWEALEDAGIAADRLAGSATGVFIGVSTNDYGHEQFQDFTRIDAYAGTGNAFSIAANRLSYLFDLRGPSLAVDTACSSSLVSVYQACQSLARGDCTLALAGGVNVILSPALAINFSKAGAMAPDGRCKSFDARANGYVRAEGAGVVVLKPLSQAVADQDRVYGVILGGAVNQDGRTNGLMAPNPHAQEAVLRRAYAQAGVRPGDVDYVEAHGTGTLLGDPIEAKALAAVVGADRDPDRPCLIGSVKSNLGHLEAAAGIAGLIKVALMLRHRTVPPSLHYERPNPHIPFGELAVRVADTLREWPRPAGNGAHANGARGNGSAGAGLALAGVSSFGFGGTNAHLVLREAPRSPARSGTSTGAGTAASVPVPVLTLSARTEPALRALADRYAAQLDPDRADLAGVDPAGDNGSVARLCFAAAVRRTHHEFRLACVGDSAPRLREALDAFARGEERAGLSWGSRRIARRPKVVFVFSGQGPRWWPLAADLIATEPVFRRALDEADALLRPYTGWSLLEQVTLIDGSRLAEPDVGQPALIAVQAGLARLWRSWGVEPAAVVGHSVGEVAAAHVAGALSLDDALRVAWHRGRVIRAAIGQGRMAVVGVGLDEARRLLAGVDPDEICVAASNGPQTTVLSGQTDALRDLAARLDADGVFCRVLESVDYASHGPQMEPLREHLRKELADLPPGGLAPSAASVPMLSTVTADYVDGTSLDADYWATNLRQPVLFDPAIAALGRSGFDTYLEISPHPMLAEAVAQRLAEAEQPAAVVSSLHRDESGRESLLGALGALYTAGFPVDWRAVHGVAGPMVALPAYPWQRQRYWLDDEYGRRSRGPRRGHPVLETYLRAATPPEAHHWSSQVDIETFPYLRDHEVGGAAVLPASLVLDAALAAAATLGTDRPESGAGSGAGRPVLEDVRFTALTLVADAATDTTLQVVLTPEAAGAGSVRIFSRPGTDPAATWTPVAQGRYRAADADTTTPSTMDKATDGGLEPVRRRCAEPVDTAGHYTLLGRAGLRYGPAFQGIAELWRGTDEAVGRLRAPSELTTDRDPYLVHPALLDSCLQTLAAALRPATPGAGHDVPTYLPVAVGRFRLTGRSATPRWAHATIPGYDASADELTGGRVVLYDEAGAVLGEVDGITLRRLDPAGRPDPVGEALLDIDWQEIIDPAAETPAVVPAGPRAGTGWWLLFTDGDGVGAGLAAALTDRGTACVSVRPGSGFRRLGATEYEIDPARREDLGTLLAELRAGQPAPLAAVVHAWTVDAVLPDDVTDDGLDRVQDLGSVSVLHLVQALVAGEHGPGTPRLALLTRGAQHTGLETAEPTLADGSGLAGSAVWGLARVIQLEHAELRPLVLDLDPDAGTPDASELVDAIDGGGDEQVVLRGGTRYRPRLRPRRTPVASGGWRRRRYDERRDPNHRVLATRPGILGSLAATAWRRTPPGPGQVEVEIAAAGLNFSDVLKAMDICPGVPPGVTPLGAECAGRVVAVGEDVTGVAVGDVVMAVAPSSLAGYTTTAAKLVAPVPAGLSAEQGAAVPIAFLTAVYGLEYLAHLGAGDTLLIHSATGGVGLAALQVARRNGAEVLATAGTPAKRDLLRALGVRHVMDSRSLDFADEVMRITGGRGVDVVLNSLVGEAQSRSLALLAANGRFVEIGKQDIYANNSLDLGLLRHNRSLLAVDLERSFAEQHDLIARLFAIVGDGFARGEFTALPVTTFPYGQSDAAFAHMAQARHTGKIVLTPERPEAVAVPVEAPPVTPGATYLVTGGLGALGLEAARYLAEHGARHLVLVGRSAPGAGAEAAIAGLRERGTEVAVRQADISRADEVASIFAAIDTSMPPLAGVIHAAGLLDDALLPDLNRDRMRAVAAPKVAGAWHLHQATAGRELDFFVLYSSAAALLGSPSQGNYAAANGVMDGLARHRHARGLPALSVNWGPWAEIGLAARPDRGGALSGRGILSLSPRDGMDALDRLLRTVGSPAAPGNGAGDPPATAQICVLPYDREGLRGLAGAGLLPSLLADLAGPADAPGASGGPGSGEVRRRLLAVEPGRRRQAILVGHCVGEAARVLKLDASTVDPTAPLASMGFDSLMSLELRKRLEGSLGIELPATVVWRFPTIEALVPFLAERMGVPLEAGPDTAAPAAGAPPVPEARPPLTADQLLDDSPPDDLELDLARLPASDIEALLIATMSQIDEGR
jgi:phthiocerol/phenolphthiocerol synthesis type-I polyketide synthase C